MSNHPFTMSVIVLTYNQAGTIGQTLNHILAQQHSYSWEIIIGEDNSTDNTREICMKYATDHPDLIRLMPPAANKGILKNYQDCLYTAQGKYIAGCAGDDWWHDPGKLQLQVDFLEHNPEFGVAYTDLDIYYTDSNTYLKAYNRHYRIFPPSGDIYSRLVSGNTVAALTAVFRSELYRKYVDMNEYSRQGFCMEDYPMWLELALVTKFKYFDRSTSTYRIAEGSLSNNRNDFRKTIEFSKSVFEIKRHFMQIKPVSGYMLDNARNDWYRDIIFAGLATEDHWKEIRPYCKRWKPNTFKRHIQKMLILTPGLRQLYQKYLHNGIYFPFKYLLNLCRGASRPKDRSNERRKAQ